MSKKQDFNVFSGNDVRLELTILDLDQAGEPVLSLVGYTAFVWALGRTEKSKILVQKSLGSGIAIISAVGGRIDVTLSRTDLEDLSGYYYHELRVTDSTGKDYTAVYGTVYVKKNLISG